MLEDIMIFAACWLLLYGTLAHEVEKSIQRDRRRAAAFRKRFHAIQREMSTRSERRAYWRAQHDQWEWIA